MKRALAIFLAILLPFAGEQLSHAQEEHRALIVPVKFNDIQIATSPETLDSLAAELAKYYNAQFRDSVKFVFDISQEVYINGSYVTYGENQSFRRDALIHKMALTVYKFLYDKLDFSIYDNDADLYVNDIILYTPGIAESAGGGENQFWPQYIDLESKDIPYSLRIRLKGFAVAPELNAEGKTAGIGLMAHEFGHILGLKDMYDTDDESSGGVCPGLGITSLMDHGMENDSGNTPPNLNAIEREILGAGLCEVLDSSGLYSLEPIHLNGRYFKLPTHEQDKYYLIENRSQEGYDAHIGGSGMLVYRVNRSSMDAGYSSYFQRTVTALERWKQNQVNCNPEYPCAEIIPAEKESADPSAIFWPQTGRAVFSPGGLALSDIHREAGGIISFKALEPVHLENVTVYQSSATVACTVSDEPGPVDSCKIEWFAPDGATGSAEGSLAADGKYYFTLKDLVPRTAYTYKVSVFYSDGACYSSSGSFTTRIHRNSIFRFIYLGDAARNRDGSFQSGAAIPLVVYNSVGEQIIWTFNDKPVSAGVDGLWTIPGDGLLKAEVVGNDGGKYVIIKEIKIK